MTGRPVTVLIADDHPLFRSGLRAALSLQAAVEIVGEAATGVEAVELARTLAPDVVVMDLHMPELGGVDATRLIRETCPSTAVLVLSMLEDDESVFAALLAGARGYLLKGAGRDDIVRAVCAVASGEAIFGPGIAERILLACGPRVPKTAPFPSLTDREREILELLATGLTNPAIAAQLFLSPKTVRNYVSAILDKLEVANRAEAGGLAREAGLGQGRPKKSGPSAP